jgi:prophage antirepressor-like protein
MDNQLQIFENAEFGKIRTVIIDNEIYFVGKDVALALGYKDTINALKAHVDAEDKRGWQITTPSGVQTMTVINESGLYSLVVSSNLPNAKKFKRWVTSEVLPSIRKYGYYSLQNVPNYKNLINDPEFIIQIGQALKAEKEKVAVLTQQVAELQPKVDYCDLILNCKDLIKTNTIAKDYGMSARSFNKLLHKLGVQYKQGEIWLLYQKYAKLGWTSTKTYYFSDGYNNNCSSVLTCWTQKGRLGLYELLKENGYLPLIEQDKIDDEDEWADIQ